MTRFRPQIAPRANSNEHLRIYVPNTRLDAQVLIDSRQLVREALRLLRESDPLVRGLRLRDKLGKPGADGDGASS
jgi:hypothetical protein